MKVSYSADFRQKLKNFPTKDQLKIKAFIDHVRQFGLANLTGRNKNSDHVPKDDPNWAMKVAYAQQHCLWHYHIGIPNYETAQNGEQVSKYILHYQRFDDEIRLVAMSYHPPFEMPAEHQLSSV